MVMRLAFTHVSAYGRILRRSSAAGICTIGGCRVLATGCLGEAAPLAGGRCVACRAASNRVSQARAYVGPTYRDVGRSR